MSPVFFSHEHNCYLITSVTFVCTRSLTLTLLHDLTDSVCRVCVCVCVCSEFYYIQMEKYARQSLAEGVKNSSDLFVTIESELYRVLVLHYNRNNQIEVLSLSVAL